MTKSGRIRRKQVIEPDLQKEDSEVVKDFV